MPGMSMLSQWIGLWNTQVLNKEKQKSYVFLNFKQNIDKIINNINFVCKMHISKMHMQNT